MPANGLWEAYIGITLLVPLFALCLVNISCIFIGRDPKFGLRMHLGVVECHVPVLGHSFLE